MKFFVFVFVLILIISLIWNEINAWFYYTRKFHFGRKSTSLSPISSHISIFGRHQTKVHVLFISAQAASHAKVVLKICSTKQNFAHNYIHPYLYKQMSPSTLNSLQLCSPHIYIKAGRTIISTIIQLGIRFLFLINIYS
jgi:hypothetical protein